MIKIIIGAGIVIGLYNATNSGWGVIAALFILLAIGDIEQEIRKWH